VDLHRQRFDEGRRRIRSVVGTLDMRGEPAAFANRWTIVRVIDDSSNGVIVVRAVSISAARS
jgi:hypothetical protein